MAPGAKYPLGRRGTGAWRAAPLRTGTGQAGIKRTRHRGKRAPNAEARTPINPTVGPAIVGRGRTMKNLPRSHNYIGHNYRPYHEELASKPVCHPPPCPYTYGRCSYGLYSYGLCGYGLCSYGLYSYGLYSYRPPCRAVSVCVLLSECTHACVRASVGACVRTAGQAAL